MGFVAQLFRRFGAQNLSLFADPFERLVCGFVDRPLFMNLNLRRRRMGRWALGAVGISVLSSLAFLSACSPEKPTFNAIDITGANYAKNFAIKDATGQTRTLADFKGKVVVVFFGYTQCPDVCPTTMTELVEVKRLLGANGDKLQAVFITVDPARDTAELLGAYVTNFDPSFVALIPTPQELVEVAKEFKIYYKKVDGKTPTSYTMEHSAGSYIFDGQGQVRLFSRYGSGAQAIAQDISKLLKQP
jgi:protein SCO1/2